MIGFAYHWTVAENLVRVLREGLRPGSWVCLRPKDASGVCLLEVRCNVDWGKGDDADRWQRVLPDGCPPESLRLVYVIGGHVSGDETHADALKRANRANRSSIEKLLEEEKDEVPSD